MSGCQGKSDIFKSDAMLRRWNSKDRYCRAPATVPSWTWSDPSVPPPSDCVGGGGRRAHGVPVGSPLQDLEYGVTCPTEARCRCHTSYSCDYRTVDVRWKCPRNCSRGCICPPPTNCCHPHCPSPHEPLTSTLSPSSSLTKSSLASSSSSSSTTPGHLGRLSRRNTSSSSPSSFPSILSPRTTTTSYPSITTTTTTTTATSCSSTSSFLSTRVDRVEVDPSTIMDSVRTAKTECALNSSSASSPSCPKCDPSKLGEGGAAVVVSNYLCDVINWRRSWRSWKSPSDSQDLNLGTWLLCKFVQFTSKVDRFMTRFSGRRRRPRRRALNSLPGYQWTRMTSFLYVIFVVMAGCLHFHVADACSSRSTPKPRPPSPTLRPNITIQTYTCPPEYAAHYCLNGATCFTVKIGGSILYNCECAEGYMGQRCEFKDLDGSYLPSKQRAMLEQAGITSGVAIMVVFVIIVCFYLYVRSRRKSDSRRGNGHDEVDTFVHQARRPFSGLHSSTTVQHHAVMPPSTFPSSGKMPGMTCESLPGPNKAANNPVDVHPPTNSTVDTKSAVLLKETIVPNNNQSRLCV